MVDSTLLTPKSARHVLPVAVSGSVPDDPVVSRTTGHLYEKKLILKAIDATGRCPVTNEELATDDLIEVKASKGVKPRPTSATSVPGLLSILQDEWDATMLEVATLRQHLETTRQELSQALYQHDAACRVIARVVRERDTARAALSQAQQMAGAAAGGSGIAATSNGAAADAEMEGDGAGGSGAGSGDGAASGSGALPAKALSLIQETAATLGGARRKRATPAGLATRSTIEGWDETSEHSLHQASNRGVLCVAISPNDARLTLSGGVDKTARLFNRQTGKVVATVKGHKKPVAAVDFVPNADVLLTASLDGTVRFFNGQDGKYTAGSIVEAHGGAAVADACAHPSGGFALSSSAEGSWSLTDIESASVLVGGDGFEAAASQAIRCHPDGVLLGVGSDDGMARIWDVTQPGSGVQMELSGHTGPVSSLAFSENGYHMATASEDGTVRVWDLRKPKTLHTFELGAPASAVAFDSSGKYIATGAADVRVHVVKEWTQLVAFDSPKERVTGVAFGPLARFLVSTSMDRYMRFAGTKSEE